MDPLLQAAPEECLALVRKFAAQGQQYRGFCVAGRAHGRGELISAYSNRFEGDWRIWNGQRHGRGLDSRAKASTYVGEWREGCEHGRGT
jgi:hypothetical protein